MCLLSSRYLEAQSQLFAHYRVEIWRPGPNYSLNNPISDWIILRYLGNEGSGVCTVFKELNWYNCFAFMRVVRKGGARRRRESGGGRAAAGCHWAGKRQRAATMSGGSAGAPTATGARRGGVGNRSAQYWRAR